MRGKNTISAFKLLPLSTFTNADWTVDSIFFWAALCFDSGVFDFDGGVVVCDVPLGCPRVVPLDVDLVGLTCVEQAATATTITTVTNTATPCPSTLLYPVTSSPRLKPEACVRCIITGWP